MNNAEYIFLSILPYMDKIKDGIEQMKKCTTEDTEFVVLISPSICQGGFKLYGCDVYAHRLVEKDKIYIVQKKELEHYLEDIIK